MSKLDIKTHHKRILRQNPDITDLGYRLWEELVDRAWSKGRTWITIKRLAEEMGRNEQVLQRATRKLIEQGFLKRHERTIDGGRKTYYLEPTHPDDWADPEVLKVPRPGDSEYSGRGTQSTSAIYEQGKAEQGKDNKSPAEPALACFPGDPIPENWRQSDEFIKLWSEWCHKRLQRKSKRERASQDTIDRARAKVAQWGTMRDCIDLMLEEAAERGWLQLRTPKQMGKEWLTVGKSNQSGTNSSTPTKNPF